MSVAIVTGSAGLVGSEATAFYSDQGMDLVGIDNNMRATFFGEQASTRWVTERHLSRMKRYVHYDIDIRDYDGIASIFQKYGSDIKLVIHAAAQPSHDWAARAPLVDFSVNANGTSVMLEATRQFAPDAVFIFMSTNKVYGDRPNQLPLLETPTRWEIDPAHPYRKYGIPETMPIDGTLHSLFGASKVAADILVQEYGRYFGMNTVCFRGGCLTGPNHSGTELHGFLAYLVKCASAGTPYTIFGYKGKQVRDNIHSADLIGAFDAYFRNPRPAEVYNMGGGRSGSCSIIEAIRYCEELTDREFQFSYNNDNRRGDHTWWITDVSKFEQHYPSWKPEYNVQRTLTEIYEHNCEKWCVA
jgi:CDP-paratose 2-epimerase